MLKNYLKIALRNVQKQKAFSFINIFGLALGLACCALMALYVHDELSFDRFHKNAEHIVRVGYEGDFGQTARTPHVLAPTLLHSSPEVKNAVRIKSLQRPVVLRSEEKIYEDNFYYVDPSLFEIFTFPFVAGDPRTALTSPFALVLTAEAAQRYFGDANPIGQTLNVLEHGEFHITGIVKNVPHNSHFRFDFLTSYKTLEAQNNPYFNDWGNFVTSTYLLLSENADLKKLESNILTLTKAHRSDEESGSERFLLHRLTELHLHASLSGELGAGGSLANIYIFTCLAMFVLLIACINYMNLATARATRRAREVGLRKVLGSARGQLLLQFLGESWLMAVLGGVLALFLVELTLPAFSALAQKELSLARAPAWLFAALAAVVLLVGLVAGSYPAFVLSRFQPVDVLKGRAASLIRGEGFRRGLVVAQFVISIVMIIGTLTILQQMEFLQNKELGFNQEQVVVLRMEDDRMRDNIEAFKHELRQHPNVLAVAAASNVPGRGLIEYIYKLEGREDLQPCITYFIDADYLATLQINVLKGRGFSRDLTSDAKAGFLLNAAAVAQFGWDDALGKAISWGGDKPGHVIGVVEDFHFESLEQKILPLVLQIEPEHYRYVAVRIRPAEVAATLAFIQAKWEAFAPNHPFQYSFLDQTFEALFRRVERFVQIFSYAAVLAIFIACLGLFGLTAFATEQRTKEIGIRKVLGAGVLQIVKMLTSEVVALVALAIVLAAPLAYWAMQRLLSDFAYRVALGWSVFAWVGAATLLIALLTVSTQALKAALANPVEALRYE